MEQRKYFYTALAFCFLLFVLWIFLSQKRKKRCVIADIITFDSASKEKSIKHFSYQGWGRENVKEEKGREEDSWEIKSLMRENINSWMWVWVETVLSTIFFVLKFFVAKTIVVSTVTNDFDVNSKNNNED